MRTLRRLLLLVFGTTAALASSQARADELLRGPFAFPHDNELAVHGGFHLGFGDSFGGPRATVDYGYKLAGSLWLALQAGFVAGSCELGPSSCDDDSGDRAEVLGGVSYKLRTEIPLVPYAKLVAGPAFLFPDAGDGAVGFAVRTGAGGTYFLYDWLGVGAELMLTLGGAGGSGIAGLDLGLGATLHF